VWAGVGELRASICPSTNEEATMEIKTDRIRELND
jgi:hypothetical protein